MARTVRTVRDLELAVWWSEQLGRVEISNWRFGGPNSSDSLELSWGGSRSKAAQVGSLCNIQGLISGRPELVVWWTEQSGRFEISNWKFGDPNSSDRLELSWGRISV